MALHHADSGELVDIQPLGPALRDTISKTLVRSEHLEVFRLVLPAGTRLPETKPIPSFQLHGESTIQCLEGEVELRVGESSHLLRNGSLIYVAKGENCALKAVGDSAILVTMLRSNGVPAL